MKKELICIVCPNGCELQIEQIGEQLSVEGAMCNRGREYAESEIKNPMRTIASSVLVENGEFPLCSVRLTSSIPKARIF